MTESINALLIFCEGPHDIAYVRMVMQKLLYFEKEEVLFKELPSPFHKLLKQTVNTHAAKELHLDMAHKFFLPDTILRNGNHLMLLFNCGGKGQYDKVRTLISDYIPAMKVAPRLAEGTKEVVDSIRYLFVYDADAEGIEGIIKSVNNNFSSINNASFINTEWKKSSHSDFGRVAGDKAVYVWGENPARGTLEDILIPLFTKDQKTLMGDAKAAVVKMFPRDTGNADPAIAVPAMAKQSKSILTLVGQGKKPGFSMSVIIEQAELLEDTTLKTDSTTKEFTNFVAEFIGLSV
ncbi:hypothetical protein [Candidatus Magnetominusculus dajiuhuensis]|uniref:hypothetical protein n=1 Tax=Candidatus Magnetominusculus dajiuhuensis TaxID=3137712 RepID=UPI003B42F3C3